MDIGDTLQLSHLQAPEGAEFVLGEDQDPDEITIATLSPPRVEEEPEPELEEEAELVGEEGEEAAEGEDADAEAGADDGGGDSGDSDDGGVAPDLAVRPARPEAKLRTWRDFL